MPAIRRLFAAAILAGTLFPASSAAQDSTAPNGGAYGAPARRAPSRPIAVGSDQQAALTRSDPTFADNSHFQVWRFSARAGQDVVVAIESAEFDPFLMLIEAGGTGEPLKLEAADSAKTARLSLRIPSDGDYLIVANTLRARATGSYKLSLKTLSDACAAGGPCVVEGSADSALTAISDIDVGAARTIALGDSQAGVLARTDTRMRDSSLFDAWRFEGRSGERVVIDHASADFDTYLILARQTASGLETLRENDDAPYTRDSQLAVELPETGTYVIVTTSLRPDTVGRYTVRLRSMAAACAAGGPCEPTANPSQRSPLFAAVPAAPSTPLSLGDTVSARLGRGDSMLGDGTFFDAYRFTGQADQEVAVLLTAVAPDAARMDTFLHLVRLENDSVVVVKSDDDGGVARNSMVTARLPRAGEYLVIANGLSVADTGNYSVSLLRLSDACELLRVCEVGAELPQDSPEATILAAAATPITRGAPVVARLEDDGPKLPDGKPFQPWRYRARAGERVVITNRSSDFDAYLYLYRVGADSLREIERNDDGGGSLDAQLSVELAEAGDYLIVAGSFSTSATGEYRLSVEEMSAACAAGGPCAVGETSAERMRLLPAATADFKPFPVADTLRAELSLSAPQLPGRGRFQSYRFDGRANDRIVISLDSEGFDPYLDLALINGPSIRVIGSDDDSGEGLNSRLVAVLPENGTYLVVASALSADSARGAGAYTLTRGPCDDACAADDGSPRVRGNALPGLVLSAERRQLPAAGVVQDSLTAAAARQAPGATFHAYWLQGIAGKTLRASLQSPQFDPYLALLRLDGDSLRSLQTDDDGGEGTSSLLEWAIDQAGTYVVVATSFSGSSSGLYTLHVEQGDREGRARFESDIAIAAARMQLGPALAAPHRVLTPGVPATGEFGENAPRLPGRGRFQSFRFSGRANDRVLLTMESTALDPYVYLARISGGTIRIIGSDDDGGTGANSRLVATLPAAGEYLVVATAYGSDTARVAPFTLALSPCDDACAAESADDTSSSSDAEANQRILRAPRRVFAPGVPLRAELVAGDSTLADGSYFHAYALDAGAGSRVRASMESSAFDTYLLLYRVQGDSLVRVALDDDTGEDTNALLEWTVDTSGSYILVANALSRDLRGEYTLTVTLTAARPQTH